MRFGGQTVELRCCGGGFGRQARLFSSKVFDGYARHRHRVAGGIQLARQLGFAFCQPLGFGAQLRQIGLLLLRTAAAHGFFKRCGQLVQRAHFPGSVVQFRRQRLIFRNRRLLGLSLRQRRAQLFRFGGQLARIDARRLNGLRQRVDVFGTGHARFNL